jgi:hypothetical protein
MLALYRIDTFKWEMMSILGVSMLHSGAGDVLKQGGVTLGGRIVHGG